ncbi:DUF1772 domain-containing protein [Nonomuraea sp. 3-1Str]|uniref:DUF1772 domain-containing protein n=1 Tax=unclassified Nonomuraea TaxID=2593643 RepID=UPI002858CB57|nr:DUF1772 domain-containing protein [Nonomuraea sp. 3-1Str]MDR8413817.1 DUF1772 domain-containing protein [Nonomuraea sp. 3-1Str]
METSPRVRYVQGLALLATGLLAGAFGYGAANVVPTFDVVPLDVRLTFHTAMMKVNEPVMQSAMALSILSCVASAVLARGVSRRLAAAAGGLTLTSLLVTVFGNVPLHAYFRTWAATGAPAGHAEILRRWELFHTVRTLTALAAFAVLIVAAVVVRPAHR